MTQHSTTPAPAGPQEPPKRRGRPPGTGKPADALRGAVVREYVTPAQRAAYEALGGGEWLRGQLDRAAKRLARGGSSA